jgi:hypothetical protein
MNLTVFYRPATLGERAHQIDQLISERNALLAALKAIIESPAGGVTVGQREDALKAIAKAEGRA